MIGQPSITNTLKNAILHNQLAQAFLFCGPRGVGKTTCARILAKTINCENLSPQAEACDACPSCVSFNENASFNIYELDGASNNSVDDIRSLVDQVRIPPQMGIYKVYIIDEVHMLSASAFNAFLKTLEEPPAYAKFILATTEKHKIIPTILSRCQIFDFRRITVDDIAGHLQYVAQQEQISTGEDALHIIAQKADGAMRDALSIFDQLVSFAGHELTYETVLENLNVLDYDYYFRITEKILNHDASGVLLILHEILEKGFDGQHLLIGFGEHIRNLLVCKDPVTVKLLETAPNIRQRYQDQAAVCPPELLLKILDVNNRCDLNYRISNNKRLHLELALMQMCVHGTTAPQHHGTTAPPPPSKPIQPVQPVTTKGFSDDLPGTISIKSPAKPTAITPEPNAEQPQNQAASSFTEEELKIHWKTFAAGLQTDFPHLATTLASSDPILKEGWQIEFELDNRILEEELNQKRGELLEFLKKNLNNYQISLQTRIPENHKEVKPYTDKEKFEKMAAKNPALNKLKEQLDLDIEY
ncbi:MAG: DNA polymerase III subunit gamma/tau [Deltaproteobacteria bacterium]|nr:DNA polymerase III subunit gamma/tau [Deltaproteobacteria bacterium]